MDSEGLDKSIVPFTSRKSLKLANAILLDEQVALSNLPHNSNTNVSVDALDKQEDKFDVNIPLPNISNSIKETSPNNVKRNDSMMVFDSNDVFDDEPSAYCTFDGNIVHYNDIFADIIGQPSLQSLFESSKKIEKLSILSIAKFNTFEGPQTTAFLFNGLHNDYVNNNKFPNNDFFWSCPLEKMRKGLFEKKLEIRVTYEKVVFNSSTNSLVISESNEKLLPNNIPVLTITLHVPNKSSNSLGKTNRPLSTIGSMNTEEVMKSSAKRIFNILAIDNSNTCLKLIARKISETNHNLTTESDSGNALELLKSMTHDVVVIDIDLLSPVAFQNRLNRTNSTIIPLDASSSPSNDGSKTMTRMSQANLLANSQAQAHSSHSNNNDSNSNHNSNNNNNNSSNDVLKGVKTNAESSHYGLKLAHEFRIFERLNRSSTQNKTTIIAMCSEFNGSMLTEAMNAGYDGFIAKPIDVADLLSIVLMCDSKKNTIDRNSL